MYQTYLNQNNSLNGQTIFLGTNSIDNSLQDSVLQPEVAADENATTVEIFENAAGVAENTAAAAEAQPVAEITAAVNKDRKIIEIKGFTQLAKEGSDLPELKKVWGNHILEGNTVLFPAERGVGKTFLSLQIAIAVAQQQPEFLGEPMQLHGNSLYINMELGDYLMKKRLAKLYEKVVPVEGNPYEAYCISERRSLTEIQPYIESYIMQYKPVLVIIDNLRTAFSDTDNEKNKDMTNAITRLNKLRDKYAFALVLVHHTKKGTSSQRTSSDLQSGAGALTDLVDGDFFLRRSQQDKALRLLKRAKSRNCEEQQGAKLLKFNAESLWFEMVEDNVDESAHIFAPDTPGEEKANQMQLAKELHEQGKTLEEIGKELGKNKSTISRWLNKKAA